MFEAFRLNKTEATGIVQWMLNSAWPSLYWQLYDYYKVPVPAYYGVKKANEPLQMIYNYGDNAIYAVNDTRQSKDVVATVEIYDLASKLLSKKQYPATLVANGVQQICTIDQSAPNSFVFLSLHDQSGLLLSGNSYCLSAKQDIYDWDKTTWVGTPIKDYADFTALDNIAQSSLKSTIVSRSENSLDLELENTSSSIAFFTQCLVKDKAGDVVYPIFWSDNYISILPGQKKILKCFFDKKEVSSHPQSIQISGWNVDSTVMPIK